MGWDALLEATGGKPEEIPDLRKIGFHKAQIDHNKKAKAELRTNDKQILTKTRKANIRDGIKIRVWAAFKRLVGVRKAAWPATHDAKKRQKKSQSSLQNEAPPKT